ncbi:autophagy protein 12-like [Amphibalanus amphitrite]|uniref:autophagy protein 12-like n=1 Tax=Amphibalanus amphitrite TaxID=1232801 RepID=UPI001C909EE5|nr:autophagy protein 12-like [Amphibalanus amphitrite]XP_043193772.1 autophagy protein 12-like [Amphibalanus amphitrite]XP_043193773.1 autophagy protein 12-like [Amphibalanus amphitrite]XP_043193774.1 autophagy protein 12-like [Amphibalanus amphitrite]XP_043193775.1 autophagy protein 12-like [Amphibalanus amphitrite]
MSDSAEPAEGGGGDPPAAGPEDAPDPPAPVADTGTGPDTESTTSRAGTETGPDTESTAAPADTGSGAGVDTGAGAGADTGSGAGVDTAPGADTETDTDTKSDAPSETKAKDRVNLLLKAAGDAPIMRQRLWKVDPAQKVTWVIQFIKRYIRMEPEESLFVYVSQAFSPAPDQTIGNLLECFGSEGKLVMHYCKTQAWG